MRVVTAMQVKGYDPLTKPLRRQRRQQRSPQPSLL
jgi:hypothetical protein